LGGLGGGFGALPPTYGYPAFGGYAAQAPAANPIGATGQPLAAANAPSANPAAPGAETPKPPRIVPNPLDNKLLIQADAQQYQNILKVLKELDVPPRQILLEAKIYEVDLTDNFASGISYALQSRGSTQGQISLPALASGSGIGTLTVGALVANGRELLATLTLNENATHVHMMSEPSLIATDSIPASINVGTQIPVSTGSTTIPAGGSTVTSESLSSENTGITLQVNARVSPTGVVTLIVNQEISSVNQSLSASASSPAFNQQTVQTQITVMDGDTIAIGGTISDNVTDSSNGIPFLSKLPGIGSLFGSKTRGHTRSELIIFMTPHVIYDETNLIEASDELKARVKLLRKMIRNL
jgi:general secretion pathway protein D